MKNATRVFASTFGAIMALAGIEHGIGEVLQGNAAPSGVMFLSWPDSAFFRSLGGEPAMTVIPNLLVTGIFAILFSLALLVWVTLFVQRQNGGLVMILISIAMLLAGGGIFPPILGILIGVVATGIHSPLTWWRTRLSPGARSFLASLWPWSFTACIIAWLLMFPGLVLLGYFFGVIDPVLILVLLLVDLGTLLSTILTGFARDALKQTGTFAGLRGKSTYRDQNQVERMDLGENADPRGRLGYFRSESPLRRVLALVVGQLLTVILGVIANATWDYKAYYGLPESAQSTSLAKLVALIFLVLRGQPQRKAGIQTLLRRESSFHCGDDPLL